MENEEILELKKLGMRIRKFRLSKDLSQEKFAELAGLDRTYISGLERGIRNPSYLIVKKIIEKLEISSELLFSEED